MPVEQIEALLSPTASTIERLKGLLALGLDHADLASATGVSVSAVRNWTSGHAQPRKGGDIVIDDLRATASILLSGGIGPRRIGQWLTSRGHADLDHERPIDAVAETPTQVLAAAHGKIIDERIVEASSNQPPHLTTVKDAVD